MSMSMALDGPIVLVVEDEPLVRLAAADSLSELGYHILEAGNADEAIALLELWSGVRVLFTDVQMPGRMDGLSLATLVRDRWPAVEIVITSGRICPDEAELPLRALFLAKPYLDVDLASTLEGICGEAA
jgi:CheY-like chemotaxis protein